MPWIDELTAAISGQRVISLRYLRNHNAAGPRTVQPHALFQTSTGEIRLDAVQVAGDTSRDAIFPAWRAFDLTLIADLELLDDDFDRDPTFNPDNPRKYHRLVVHCGG